jgi:hypothetical protein
MGNSIKTVFRVSTALLLGALLASTPLSASASSDWSPVGSTDEGFHEIIVQDSVPFFRQFSFLHVDFDSKQFVCADMSRGICRSPQAAQFNVILPVCSTASETDCIEFLSSTKSDGTSEVGSFERYSMPTHPSLFRGDGRILPRNPQSPSIWNLPSAAHAGGVQYAVHAGITGEITGGRVVSSDFYAQVYAFKEIPGAGEAFDQNGYSNFSYCDFKPNRQINGCGGGGPTPGAVCVIQLQVGGACGAQQDLPPNTSFSLKFRISQEPNGWYHGRLTKPSIVLEKKSRGVALTISGDPVEVPVLYHQGSYKDMPRALKGYWDSCVRGNLVGRECPTSTRQFGVDMTRQPGEKRNITSEQKPWTPKALETVKFFRNFTAGLSPKADQVWAVRSLESSSNQSSACYARPGFKGLISTNATAYSSGPPTLARGILNYSLAAPSQYVGAIEEISGSYDLVMRRDFASCVYGGREVSPRASISVTQRSGTRKVATSITSRSPEWIRVTAREFTY